MCFDCRSAIDEGKPIQLLLEDDERFGAFDLGEWNAQPSLAKASGGVRGAAIPPEICGLVDANLPEAVTFRRRDFEADAMMRELCVRNGLVLPTQPSPSAPPDSGCVRVFVIYSTASGSAMFEQLRGALAEHTDLELTCDLEEPAELDSADSVLLLLTAGVLGGATLTALERGIERDAEQGRDRITAVYSQAAGWQIGCVRPACPSCLPHWRLPKPHRPRLTNPHAHAAQPEQKSAPVDVQGCLEDHEARLLPRGCAYPPHARSTGVRGAGGGAAARSLWVCPRRRSLSARRIREGRAATSFPP
eukprot:SAG11_NODE_980_length_6319_cov_2.389068_2_plen_304_part_00